MQLGPETFWRKLVMRDGCRRGYPRVHAGVPIRFLDTPAGTVKALSNDISPGGMQVRCDRQTAAQLRPDSAAGRMAQKPTYRASMLLETDGRPVVVEVRCRIVHVTLVDDAPAEQEVAVGIEFLEFDDAGDEALERYVAQFLRPAGG